MVSHSKHNTEFDELQFAEDFAGLMRGFPPIAGRMLGLLLVTEEPCLSSRDLMERLGASSAWSSNMGRLLTRMGLVERSVSPETRRDLFSIRPDAWVNLAHENANIAQQYVDLVDQALPRRVRDGNSVKKLAYMRD